MGLPARRVRMGRLVSEGDTRSAADGSLSLKLSTQADRTDPGIRQRYTLEVSATDANGLPVSARASALVDPAGDTIGIHSDRLLAPAGEQAGFDIQLLDWQGNPAGGDHLRAEFRKLDWAPQSAPNNSGSQEAVSQTNFHAGGQHRFRDQRCWPGAHRLQPAESRHLPDQSQRRPSQQRFSVVGQRRRSGLLAGITRSAPAADRRPGELCSRRYCRGYSCPIPGKAPALALVSVERGTLLRHQVLPIQGNGQELQIPLSAEDAPNVYLSVTLLGRDQANQPDFRQGILNLSVDPAGRDPARRSERRPPSAAQVRRFNSN